MPSKARERFDCNLCKKQGWYKDRICFKEKETYEMTIPNIVYKGDRYIADGYITEEVDEKRFFQLLRQFRDLDIDTPLYRVMDKHFRGMCVVSILNMTDMHHLTTEAFCSEYKVLPYSGSMVEQPNLLVEIFNVIRQTRNDYERIRQKNMEKRVAQKNASNGNPTSLGKKVRY